jgi:alpha-tubulin suppressor-like RCC1 family protein
MCGITSSGTYCWGRNQFGQLGAGDTTNRTTPQAVLPPTGSSSVLSFSTISAGGDHTCGTTSGGTAYCWGNNQNGQLGVGDTTQRTSPTVLSGYTFSSLAAGENFTCGITASGTYCWGFNFSGQLGVGDTIQRTSPTLISGFTFSSIATGGFYACGITASGTFCRGSNFSGQLGDGTTEQRTVPTLVSGALTFSSLELGIQHSCGITSSGTTFCWGTGNDGQLGVTFPIPTRDNTFGFSL